MPAIVANLPYNIATVGGREGKKKKKKKREALKKKRKQP